MEYKHIYENGEWHRERTTNVKETKSKYGYIQHLERLHDLHKELNQQTEGWEDVLESTERKLEDARE